MRRVHIIHGAAFIVGLIWLVLVHPKIAPGGIFLFEHATLFIFLGRELPAFMLVVVLVEVLLLVKVRSTLRFRTFFVIGLILFVPGVLWDFVKVSRALADEVGYEMLAALVLAFFAATIFLLVQKAVSAVLGRAASSVVR